MNKVFILQAQRSEVEKFGAKLVLDLVCPPYTRHTVS